MFLKQRSSRSMLSGRLLVCLVSMNCLVGQGADPEKAAQYRYLNQPVMAESICVDVLRLEPENQEALILLLLSITDQFDQVRKAARGKAKKALAKLKDEYHRTYYAGIMAEREARAFINRGVPGGRAFAYEGYREAMELYEQAEKLSPTNDDDAILRWNTCARMIEQEKLKPRLDDVELPLE